MITILHIGLACVTPPAEDELRDSCAIRCARVARKMLWVSEDVERSFVAWKEDRE